MLYRPTILTGQLMMRLVAPLFRPAVLQPENLRRDVRRAMLARFGPNDLTAVIENLLAIECVANSALIQAALDPIV